MGFFKNFYSLRLGAFIFALLAAGAVFLTYFGQSNIASTEKGAALTKPETSSSFSANPDSLKTTGSLLKNNNCKTAIPSSMDVTFNVSGMQGAVKSVDVKNLTFDSSFKWGAGLSAVLISPDGTVSQTLFGNPDANVKICTETVSLSGPYSYTDSADAAAGRTTLAAAGSKDVNPVKLNSAFQTLNDANGTWILRLTDNAGGALGAVSNVSLSIQTAQAAAPQVTHKNADFDGDGKSDYAVVRIGGNAGKSGSAVSAPRFDDLKPRRPGVSKLRRTAGFNGSNLAPNDISWFVKYSSTSTFGKTDNGDFDNLINLVPADYDGDGKTDVAVWSLTDATHAAFYIVQSSTDTLRVENFGEFGDDPSVTADYDGDGKADPAVLRCSDQTPGPCYYYFRGSLNNPSNSTTVVPWGYGVIGDFYPYVGDFDGDSKADFCLQRETPNRPGAGQFVLLRSTDFGVEYINWGRALDTIVPGDYDGDGKTDFAVMRPESVPQDTNADRYSFYILYRAGGGTGVSPIRFGEEGDFLVPGDYDGDGKTDVAVWRYAPDSSDPTPDQSKFIVYRSFDKGVTYYPWGIPDDFSVAGWQVH